ncbi:MAG: hypothetical protein EBX71_04010, partial [Betaproteobacteria bacterium]|nr:hypothetical protein [Betaproteobacteria bacterium]
MFREESIGQLIAEAIKKVEEKNASEEDYSFLKQFVEWINKMLDAFGITTEQDPFEIAAMKILSSDMSDLLTYEEYKELSDVAYFTDVVAEQKFEFARKLDKYPLLTKYAEIIEELDDNGNVMYDITSNNPDGNSGYQFINELGTFLALDTTSSPTSLRIQKADNGYIDFGGNTVTDPILRINTTAYASSVNVGTYGS